MIKKHRISTFILLGVILIAHQACFSHENYKDDYSNVTDIHHGCIFDKFTKKETLTMINRLDEVIANNGENYAYFVRAECYRSIGMLEDSIADYSFLIEKDFNNLSLLHESRGDVYRSIQRHKKSLDDYTKSIELNNKNFGTYKKRGDLYKEIGKMHFAISDYLSAIDILKSRRECGKNCYGYAVNEVDIYIGLLNIYNDLGMNSAYKKIKSEALQRNPGSHKLKELKRSENSNSGN